jgi:hypothetical protein
MRLSESANPGKTIGRVITEHPDDAPQFYYGSLRACLEA